MGSLNKKKEKQTNDVCLLNEEPTMIDHFVGVMVSYIVAEYIEEETGLPNPYKEAAILRKALNYKKSCTHR